MSETDVSFKAMGCDVRLIVGDPAPGMPEAEEAIDSARRYVKEFEATLSRFRHDSELTVFNADPRPRVPASRLLRAAIHAGVWAAEYSDGLVVPTLVGELRRAGYARSRKDARPASLEDALRWAPQRRPARPDPRRRWREIRLDHEAGLVDRPVGLEFDTGGIGKGLAADVLAERLQGYSRFIVDCGGDIRVGGRHAARWPCDIEVEHPLTGECAHTLSLSGGAVATSGINVRVWRHAGGGYGHHLIDPSTGEPAWTGLIAVTALADTALEAETLSKGALLSGPRRALRLLSRRGGVLVHDEGNLELAGPALLGARARVRIPRSALAPRAAA